MTIDWRKVQEIPEDKQLCHIYLDRGLACSVIILEVTWSKEANGWLDLFDSAEAGQIYPRTRVSAWCPAEELTELSDEFQPLSEGL